MKYIITFILIMFFWSFVLGAWWYGVDKGIEWTKQNLEGNCLRISDEELVCNLRIKKEY